MAASQQIVEERGEGEGEMGGLEAGNPTPGPTEIILFNTLLLVRI